MGQAANRKACVLACALQMPRPQKLHTPSAVAPHTQQCTRQGYRVAPRLGALARWRWRAVPGSSKSWWPGGKARASEFERSIARQDHRGRTRALTRARPRSGRLSARRDQRARHQPRLSPRANRQSSAEASRVRCESCRASRRARPGLSGRAAATGLPSVRAGAPRLSVVRTGRAARERGWYPCRSRRRPARRACVARSGASPIPTAAHDR